MSFDQEKVIKYVKMGCNSTESRESTFRESVVLWLIQAMGWEHEDVEVEKELVVGSGHTIRPDYVLTNGNVKVIIEAKPPTQPIENYYEQLTSYMKLLEAKYGFIYNGKKLALFKRKPESGWDSGPAFVWECTNNVEIFEALSKGGVIEKLDRFLDDTRNNTVLDRTIADRFHDVAEVALEKIGEFSGLPANFVKSNVSLTIRTARLKMDSADTVPSETYSTGQREATLPKAISREELRRYPEGEVVVCPSTGGEHEEEGERFMLAHYAWRYVKMNHTPKYFALYQGSPHSKVRWFAKIAAIKEASDTSLSAWYNLPPYDEDEAGKKVILLEPGSEVILKEPIERASWGGLRYLTYTTLSKFAGARTLDDL